MTGKKEKANHNTLVTKQTLEKTQLSYHPPQILIFKHSHTGTGGINIAETNNGQLES